MGNAFTMLVAVGIILMAIGSLFYKPILYAFGASDATFPYAEEYIQIYLLGTVFVMVSIGMNPFINGQGFGNTGMFTVLIDQEEYVYQDTLDLLEYGLGDFSKVKISEDKTYYEDMLKRENPIFKNCVISEFNANSLYVILPKEISVTDRSFMTTQIIAISSLFAQVTNVCPAALV